MMTDTSPQPPDEPAGDHADGHAGGRHAPFLAHHFGSQSQQFASGKLGIWIFLVTEILFFGGLFCAYTIYRAHHPEIFVWAHKYLDTNLGALNTVVLIFSSLTMAWGVRCAQCNQRRGLIACLVLTLLCACGFLGVKAVEYQHKWKDGLLWAKEYDPSAAALAGQHGEHVDEHAAETSAPRVIDEQPKHVGIFFSIYFAMTGLHGLHVIGGMVAITWLLVRSIKGHFSSEYFGPVDYVGLYWHLVDLIWIFLFPLLYLIH